MNLPNRFRIAVAAPFPHPHLTLEGWMTRIAQIDAQLAGMPRIYPHFSDRHADAQCTVVEHDAERAEALLVPGGEASTAVVSRLVETVEAFYVHTLHLAEHLLPWLDTGKVYVDIHGVTPEEEELLGPPAPAGALRGGGAGGAPRRGLLHRRQRGDDRALRGEISVAAPAVVDGAGLAELPRAGVGPRTAGGRPASGGAVQRRRAGVAEPGRDAGAGRLGQRRGRVPLLFPRARGDPTAGGGAGGDATAAGRLLWPGGSARGLRGGGSGGLVLRDDSAVNRVACPTKLAEYLYFGLIPVVRSPRLGDFEELGYAYVTEQEFRDGFIPDAASRDWMAEQNRDVVRQLAARFETAALDLRTRLAETSPAQRPAPDDGMAAPPPEDAPQCMDAPAAAVEGPPSAGERASAGEPPSADAPPSMDAPVAGEFHDLRDFRRRVLDRHVDLPCRVLEVGAYCRPTVAPSETTVKVIDYYSTEELAVQAREAGDDPEALVPVDYVCRTDDYADAVDETFDVLIANHVLEHVDRPIRWLQTARTLLRDGGVLFLVLPDKKQSFDRFRPDTPLSHLLFEHLAPEHDVAAVHSLKTALHYDRTYIGETNRPETSLDVERLKHAMTASHPGVHRHRFQAETFAGRLMKPLLYTGLVDFDLLDVTNCPQFGEFAAVLKASRNGRAADPGDIFLPATDSFRSEPALPRTEPAPQPSVPAQNPGKGLEWGAHSFRFDYDYAPRVRPFETTAAGRRIRELLQADDTVRETIRTVDRFRERFANIAAHAHRPARAGVGADLAACVRRHADLRAPRVAGPAVLPGDRVRKLDEVRAARHRGSGTPHANRIGRPVPARRDRRAVRSRGAETRRRRGPRRDYGAARRRRRRLHRQQPPFVPELGPRRGRSRPPCADARSVWIASGSPRRHRRRIAGGVRG